MVKVCTECNQGKTLEQFYKEPRGRLGVFSKCKACIAIKSKSESRKATRNVYKLVKRSDPLYRATENQKSALRMREYRRDPETRKKLAKKNYEYISERMKTDPGFKLIRRLRMRLSQILKGRNKSGSAVRDLGCSPEELRSYIESLFKPGMTWDNWGSGKGKWNIDHVVELANFNLEDRSQLLIACNYRNLQPMWQEDHDIKTNNFKRMRNETFSNQT